jgi:hypothetical protein
VIVSLSCLDPLPGIPFLLGLATGGFCFFAPGQLGPVQLGTLHPTPFWQSRQPPSLVHFNL